MPMREWKMLAVMILAALMSCCATETHDWMGKPKQALNSSKIFLHHLKGKEAMTAEEVLYLMGEPNVRMPFDPKPGQPVLDYTTTGTGDPTQRVLWKWWVRLRGWWTDLAWDFYIIMEGGCVVDVRRGRMEHVLPIGY